MKPLNTQTILRRFFAMFCAMMLLGVIATPAFAEEDNERACQQATQNASKEGKEGKEMAGQYSKMRSACSTFRDCKKKCRANKRKCKKDARSLKRDCRAYCADKRAPSVRRKCRKACRKAKKARKSKCRQETRSCKTVCASTEKSPACVAARSAFWGKARKVKGSAAQTITKQCVKEYSKN